MATEPSGTVPGTYTVCAVQRKEFLGPARLHVCPFSLLASDLVTGLRSLFLPSYSKLEEDRRQHKTTRALGEIPRLRAK